MPVLIVKYNSKNLENPQTLRLTRNFLELEEITLTGYSCHIKKVPLVAPATQHLIPKNLFITLDFLQCAELNVGLPRYGTSSDGRPLYHLINKLPLPLSNEDYTIKFGMDLTFNLCQAIHRDLKITVEHYNNSDTLQLAETVADGTGKVAIEDVTLYFDYKEKGKDKDVSRRNYMIK